MTQKMLQHKTPEREVILNKNSRCKFMWVGLQGGGGGSEGVTKRCIQEAGYLFLFLSHGVEQKMHHRYLQRPIYFENRV